MADYLAPTSLAATTSSASTIALSWTNTEADYFIQIQRKPSGGVYQTITEINFADSYSDTTCSANVRYYYRIRYIYGSAYSDWSGEADDYTYPATPTGLAATWSQKTASLSWTNGAGYTYVRVYYKATADSTWTTDTTTLSGTATSRDITVATENTLYDFRVCGYNSTSGYTSAYNTITSQRSSILAPSNLLLTSASTTSITATWVDNSSVEDGYEVYYIKTDDIVLGGESEYTLFETTAADVETSTITGLDEDTEYTIRVRVKDGAYYSSYIADSVSTGAIPDAAPVIGTVTVVSQTALTVAWTCAASNESGFKIYRSTDGVAFAEVGDADENETSYADTGLESYTEYYYIVRAYNEYGVSDASDSASGVTSIDLDPPTAIVAEALSSTQIKISFTVNAGKATRHYVERKTTGGSYSVLGYIDDGTTAEYTDGTCSADTDYTFRIRAYSSVAVQYGDYSVPVTKRTLAVGTDTVRRNEAFFAMGNVICIASETPQNSFEAYWRSKPLDFSEIDQDDGNRFKTVDRVQLEYFDSYASVPVVISLSTDGGTTWTTSAATVGTGDLTDKIEDFWFVGVTGKYITLKISSEDSDTGFTWTGIIIHYFPRGEYWEAS